MHFKLRLYKSVQASTNFLLKKVCQIQIKLCDSTERILAFNFNGDKPGGWWVVTLSVWGSVSPSIEGMWTNLKGKFCREISTNNSCWVDRALHTQLNTLLNVDYVDHVDHVWISLCTAEGSGGIRMKQAVIILRYRDVGILPTTTKCYTRKLYYRSEQRHNNRGNKRQDIFWSNICLT